jgi:tRNA1Val (adenine37-N6)-methyltransferase
MFQFKQFTIHQDQCAMKVGTDGVLLGAWTDCSSAQRILDIGIGTGLIALMLAQRSKAIIDGIEIDELATQQALQNVENSPWAERINIIHQSFQDFCNTQTKPYDLIVSNPPYFENSLKSPSASRTTARHTDSLTSLEIISACKKLLTKNGKLSLILPVQEGIECIVKAKEQGLYLQRKTTVIPRRGAAVKRILLCVGFEDCICQEAELLIEMDSRHEYSEEYKELTRDYYLKF